MHAKRQRILVVDDDVDELFFTKKALNRALTDIASINVLKGGNEAVAYMMGEGKFADRSNYPFPSLLVTDLSMPEGDGFHILEFMQANPAWNVVPRIVLSASNDEDDVRTAYLLGASAYHLKPMDYGALETRMRQLIEYWATAEVAPVDENGRTLVTNSTGRKGARYPQPQAGSAMVRPS